MFKHRWHCVHCTEGKSYIFQFVFLKLISFVLIMQELNITVEEGGGWTFQILEVRLFIGNILHDLKVTLLGAITVLFGQRPLGDASQTLV